MMIGSETTFEISTFEISAVILSLLATGTVAGLSALILNIRGNAPQNRGSGPHRIRTGIAYSLTIVAATCVVASLICSALPPFGATTIAANPLYEVLAPTLALVLATVGGGPFAVLALRLATRGETRDGVHGGILIDSDGAPVGTRTEEQHGQDGRNPQIPRKSSFRTLFGGRLFGYRPPATRETTRETAPGSIGASPTPALRVPSIEVLRGGTTIGLLERLAIAGAVMAGFPEAIAVVTAIKGVGRFGELAASEAKERFIIGTLASFVWACACAFIVR